MNDLRWSYEDGIAAARSRRAREGSSLGPSSKAVFQRHRRRIRESVLHKGQAETFVEFDGGNVADSREAS